MDNKFDLNQRKIRNYSFRDINTNRVIEDRKFEDHLAKLDETKKFNKDNFDYGSQFFKNGGSIENANPELKNDKDFLNGYARAQRVAKIQEHNNKFGR